MIDQPSPTPLRCPRCGSTNVNPRGESVQYGPEQWPNQPLREREIRTLAYQCDCGLGFTTTAQRGE